MEDSISREAHYHAQGLERVPITPEEQADLAENLNMLSHITPHVSESLDVERGARASQSSVDTLKRILEKHGFETGSGIVQGTADGGVELWAHRSVSQTE
jgi:hypothetical protein